ncbi:MAG: DUF262 domain-containing protein [Gammaproteobacteria bacterium]|nr:DUF262 domain-containing protein [Gammaproteobacteria bacterium]
MASRANLVNLDAMIKRADFASEESDESLFENVSTISVRDFTKGGLIGPSLRKPDFQRETNHWTPQQVVSLLECFTSGDLIPSVILWQSPTYLFVIDGGHRLSVLRAWIEDDYGDGPLSQGYFGNEISDEQQKIAEKTRKLVHLTIGSWQHFQAKLDDEDLDMPERKRVNAIISRGLPIQWVKGDADKAESSFFKINTKGTPLDSIEELLLKSRKRPISIAARAIIRSGKGHKYWSSFPVEVAKRIEGSAKSLHKVLFEPEIKRPIKTLDLPLGGSKGIRVALQVLIDFMLIANRNQEGKPKDVYGHKEDLEGGATVQVLKKSEKLANRITGNDKGSLGLHPAVYFYGPSGRHSSAMFMGTVKLLGAKLINNDPTFFPKFTSVRCKLEDVLIENKELIATILQKNVSTKRVDVYFTLLNEIINALDSAKAVDDQFLIDKSGLNGKLIVGGQEYQGSKFSDDIKSEAFIYSALSSALKCPICSGYLDPEKSVSYDHVIRAREEGKGGAENCQLTHPYCNQSVKR